MKPQECRVDTPLKSTSWRRLLQGERVILGVAHAARWLPFEHPRWFDSGRRVFDCLVCCRRGREVVANALSPAAYGGMCEHVCQKDTRLCVCNMVWTGRRLLKMKSSDYTLGGNR